MVILMSMTTRTPTITTMTIDKAALFRLMAWLSPSYPVGAFAYSHGLEWLVATGDVTTAATLSAWLEDVLRHGGGWSDAVLLQHAWRAATKDDPATLQDWWNLPLRSASRRNGGLRPWPRAEPS